MATITGDKTQLKLWQVDKQQNEQELATEFKKYEGSTKNRHFLCWYKGEELHGGIIFDKPWEKNILKQQDLSLAKKLLERSVTLPINPGIKDVLGLVKFLAPSLVIAMKEKK